MTDLIKRLGDPNRDWPEFGHDRREAVDRIEELVRENRELTLQLLATSGQAADALDKLAKAVEARDTWREISHNEAGEAEHNFETMLELSAKLAKAVEALRFYADFYAPPKDWPWSADSGNFGTKARNVLAELEGGSEPDQKQSV